MLFNCIIQIAHASYRTLQRELTIFEELRQQVVEWGADIIQVAHVLSEVDVASALAVVAIQNNYCRPMLHSSTANQAHMRIVNGRHPVVEAAQGSTGMDFTSNDCVLSAAAVCMTL